MLYIAFALNIVAISLSCVLAKFWCKLGVPQYKPWQPNKKFYMEEEFKAA